MRKKKYINWFSGLIAVMMLFLTACQSIGGVDLNKALKSSLEVKSYEGSGSFTLELSGLGEDLQDDAVDLSFLKHLKIDFSNVKVQDEQTISFQGSAFLGTREIPFAMTMDQNELAIDLEGAEQPLYIDLQAYDEGIDPYTLGMVQNMTQTLEENQMELIRSVGSFVIDHLPNPQTIRVTNVMERINNENLNMQKVHVRIGGDEVIGLLKQFIDSVLADDEGLKEVINQVYNLVIVPVQEEIGEDDWSSGFVDEIHQVLKEELQKFSTQLEGALDLSGAEMFLNESNYLTFDIFVDNSQQIRRMDSELSVKIPGQDGEPAGLKLTSTQDMWNIDHVVEVDKIDTSNALVLDDNFTTAAFIKNLDSNSELYKLLADDLNIRAKSIVLPVWEGEAGEERWGMPYIDPVTEKTMVPVRFVAEELDSEVKWDGANQQVTISDAWTGNTIVLTIGSSTATVNGTEVQLEGEAQLTDSTTYVPVRFIAETFGAEVGWDNDLRAVIISRD